MPNYYPIMLDVRNRQVIVIGGDRIAAEKAAALSASGARVTVMSSSFGKKVRELAESGAVTLLQKEYERGDLVDAFVVVAAVTDPELIERIWSETQERGQLLNIVDVPARCNYIVPSILRRGQLTVAVSTEGASPGLAKRIRHQLEEHFPPAYDRYMQLATVVRAYLREHNLSYSQRDDFFGDFFTSSVLHLLTLDEEEQAIALTVDLLERYGVRVSGETLTRALKASKGNALSWQR